MKGHEVSGWWALLVIGLVITHTLAVALGKWLQRENDRARIRAYWKRRTEKLNRMTGGQS